MRNLLPNALAPDMIITNGKIITVDANFSFAEAVAVKNGKIVAVGSANAINEFKGANTKTLDLKGNTLMPGLNDSHMHLTWKMLSNKPYKIDLRYPKVKSIADIRELVKQAAAEAEPGQWILGDGWSKGYLEEIIADPANRKMNIHDFDDITPDNPLFLMEITYHNVVVNSLALKLANITKNTPDPEGGIIWRDNNGEPTGLLVEKARLLVERVRTPLAIETMAQALRDNIHQLSDIGITSVTTAAEGADEMRAFCAVALDGSFPVRINCALQFCERGELGGDLEDYEAGLQYIGLTTGFGNEWLKIGGVKIFADGSPEYFTSWNYNPYPDGSYGGLVFKGKTDDEKVARLNKIVDMCHRHRFQIAAHTTGDRCIYETVKAFAQVMEEDPWDARHYIIHGDWIVPEAQAMMAKYNIGYSPQASMKAMNCDDITRIFGEERSGEQWPMKELWDKGIVVANGSDAPCAPLDWRNSMQASILREGTLSGKVSGAHQCLNIEEAIRAYTINPAWLEHAEDSKGSIEPGKLADFCILGRDITTIDPHEISATPVLMTIVGGKVVFNDGTLQLS